MHDYDTTTDDYPEELLNLVMFGPCVDEERVTYEEKAEKEVWRKAMDDETGAIEKKTFGSLHCFQRMQRRYE